MFGKEHKLIHILIVAFIMNKCYNMFIKWIAISIFEIGPAPTGPFSFGQHRTTQDSWGQLGTFGDN